MSKSDPTTKQLYQSDPIWIFWFRNPNGSDLHTSTTQTAELGSAAPEIVFNKKFRAPNIILHVIFMSDCAPSTPQHDRQGLSNRLLTQPHYMDTNSGVVRFLIFDHAVISERQGREAYSGTDRGSSPEKFWNLETRKCDFQQSGELI
jgi:hypothetical protein